MEKISRVAAIKRYFEADGGRKVEMREMQALSKEEREYLAVEAAKQLGVELDTPAS